MPRGRPKKKIHYTVYTLISEYPEELQAKLRVSIDKRYYKAGYDKAYRVKRIKEIMAGRLIDLVHNPEGLEMRVGLWLDRANGFKRT